jgi:negative regulator of flagellin synthesis FlgM
MMKIGNPAEKIAPASTGTPARTQAGETKANEAAAADPSAKVELSNAATSLMSGTSNSEFDADKVARIAQAITDGKFQINADAIADKLIANAKEVLGKH